MVNHPALPLGEPGGAHLGDDLLQGLRGTVDRARQGPTAEGAEADLAQLWLLLRAERHPLIVPHDPLPLALHPSLCRILQD